MKVINLFGGPSSGKSTTAAMLFALFKLRNINCELVTEFAKSLVWSERYWDFKDQLYILAKQNHRLEMLRNKVEIAITDGPILLSSIYRPEKYFGSFDSLVEEVYLSYDNINVFLNRAKPYNPVGRNQTEEEAKQIDEKIKQFFTQKNVLFFDVNGDKNAAQEILNCVNY